ncbi:hypothetical protein SPRG_20647 [Saprolegnia parasitica CBS 223.65]|uniref:Uncharacterized protein n=1 Tax=Saprolegnia parasitica (strain CBS 223.65) TaxID=695850 RepID=A0A067C8N3_SAPPC|nr:hypothetical protein SPRG_20647 [Saprolegnia parasitica CBS 223.65]KDO25525.1 hypothetical protein SPRG_20647 [Saprolegnia parasitica CBS 223.65]|eukprot:XP_012203756.1 hypothetical protein SPRG_20647 [Saprolegnia parasitica CBS 223.65]
MPCALCAKSFNLIRRRHSCVVCSAAICRDCAGDSNKCLHCKEAAATILPSKPTTSPKLLLSYRGTRKPAKQDGVSRRPSPLPIPARRPWVLTTPLHSTPAHEPAAAQETFDAADFIDDHAETDHDDPIAFLSVRCVRVEPHVAALRAHGPLSNLLHQAAFAANATIASIQLIDRHRVFAVAAYGYNDWSQGVWDHSMLVQSLEATPVPGTSSFQGVGHLTSHPWSAQPHVKTFMSIPVMVDDDDCIGTLDLASTSFTVPTPESIQELQVIAQSLGPMLVGLIDAWPASPQTNMRLDATPTSYGEAHEMMQALIAKAEHTADVVRSQRSLAIKPLASSEIGICSI